MDYASEQAIQWYGDDQGSPHAAIAERMKFLLDRQSTRRESIRRCQQIYGVDLGAYGLAPDASIDRRFSINHLKNSVDTLAAKISRAKVLPFAVTSGGDYMQRKRAEKLSRFIDGAFHDTDFWTKSLHVDLATLVDGRLQTLDPRSGGSAPDPIDAAQPIAPLSLRTPGYRNRSHVPPMSLRPSRITKLRPGLFICRWHAAPIPLIPAPTMRTSTCSVVMPPTLPPPTPRFPCRTVPHGSLRPPGHRGFRAAQVRTETSIGAGRRCGAEVGMVAAGFPLRPHGRSSP